MTQEILWALVNQLTDGQILSSLVHFLLSNSLKIYLKMSRYTENCMQMYSFLASVFSWEVGQPYLWLHHLLLASKIFDKWTFSFHQHLTLLNRLLSIEVTFNHCFPVECLRNCCIKIPENILFVLGLFKRHWSRKSCFM